MLLRVFEARFFELPLHVCNHVPTRKQQLPPPVLTLLTPLQVLASSPGRLVHSVSTMKIPSRVLTVAGRIDRVILHLARVSRLDDEFSPVPVQSEAVYHVVAVILQASVSLSDVLSLHYCPPSPARRQRRPSRQCGIAAVAWTHAAT